MIQPPAADDSTQLDRLERLVLSILSRQDPQSRLAWARINELMLNAYQAAGLNYLKRHVYWWYVKTVMTRCAKQGKRLPEIEARLRRLYRRRREKFYYPASLKRAEGSFERIKDYLVGSSVLDLGAGNGLLGQSIHDRTNMTVMLADVIDYSVASLPLLLFPQGGRVPLDDQAVDCTILYVVLHHADDPLHLLKEAARVTKQRVIIVEGYVEDETIYLTNSFLDWFLNRVNQGADINLPLNYHKQEQWYAMFDSVGLQPVKTEVLGIDEPVAPECHVLYVLDKKESLLPTASASERR